MYEPEFAKIVGQINQRHRDALPKKKNTFNSAYDKATWENEPLIDDAEEKERLELIGKAKKGCAISIETLKRAPFSLKVLVLNGQKII